MSLLIEAVLNVSGLFAAILNSLWVSVMYNDLRNLTTSLLNFSLV